jgi:hypothetical protein
MNKVPAKAQPLNLTQACRQFGITPLELKTLARAGRIVLLPGAQRQRYVGSRNDAALEQ